MYTQNINLTCPCNKHRIGACWGFLEQMGNHPRGQLVTAASRGNRSSNDCPASAPCVGVFVYAFRPWHKLSLYPMLCIVSQLPARATRLPCDPSSKSNQPPVPTLFGWPRARVEPPAGPDDPHAPRARPVLSHLVAGPSFGGLSSGVLGEDNRSLPGAPLSCACIASQFH